MFLEFKLQLQKSATDFLCKFAGQLIHCRCFSVSKSATAVATEEKGTLMARDKVIYGNGKGKQ